MFVVLMVELWYRVTSSKATSIDSRKEAGSMNEMPAAQTTNRGRKCREARIHFVDQQDALLVFAVARSSEGGTRSRGPPLVEHANVKKTPTAKTRPFLAAVITKQF